MATSPNSPETNWSPSISSPADSPARTSRKPGSESASRELARAFGLNSPVSLGFLDLDTSSLRTYQGSLFQKQCDEWSESWPDSGMWDLGSVYELQISEPVTCVSESSSWPTPNAHDGRRPGSDATSTQGANLKRDAENWG